MTQESLCPICKKKIETLTRCFRDCYRVRKVWDSLWSGRKPPIFFHGDLNTWMTANPKGNYDNRISNWSQCFGVTLDRI